MRTWRVVFDVEFGHVLPSLHIEDDLIYNFKQDNSQIHVTITTYSLTSSTITVYVSLYK